jgi:hypothetical protein
MSYKIVDSQFGVKPYPGVIEGTAEESSYQKMHIESPSSNAMLDK